MSTSLDHRDDYDDDAYRETAADVRAAFYAQASPEEAEQQTRSEGWRP